MNLTDLFSRFISLGNNCEFGMVQEAAGCSGPELFKNVGFLHTEQIIKAIADGLAGMFDDGAFAFVRPEGWPDIALDCHRFGFRFHTALSAQTDPSPAQLQARLTAFRFMKQKFLDDLALGQKIFTYRHKQEWSEDLAQRLLAAIRRHGSGSLLYVREDLRPDYRFGWAEATTTPHLYVGGVPHLTNENPPQVNFPVWEKIARATLQLIEGVAVEARPHPPPPAGTSDVVAHVLTGDGPVLSCSVEAEPGVAYTGRLSVWLPSDTVVANADFVMIGFESETFNVIDLARRDAWQELFVSTHVPSDQHRIVPTLLISGAPGGTIFTSGLTVTRDGQAPARTVPAAAAVPVRYRIVPLGEILASDLRTAAGAPRVVKAPCLPDVDVDIPRVSYGQVEPPADAVQWPPDNWHKRSYAVRDAAMFTLRDAVVHGEQGIITIDDMIVAESLYLGNAALAGFEPAGAGGFLLRQPAPSAWIDKASHALCGYVSNRNYAHWWIDVVAAFLVPPFHEAFDQTTLILPPIRASWQRETLDLLPEVGRHAVFIGEHSRIGCRELRFVPSINRSDFEPHPFRTRLIDIVKQRAGCDLWPHRRLYVSRRDAGARPLANDAEVAALVGQHGFETVTLTGRPVAEQIRLFASATHVVSPHGAGLGNVLFCNPDAALCELQMLSNLQWSIRRLAAVAGLRYGCVMGHAADDSLGVDQRTWRVDLGQLAQVLADPAFTRPPAGNHFATAGYVIVPAR